MVGIKIFSEEEINDYLSDNRTELMKSFIEEHFEEFREFVKKDYKQYLGDSYTGDEE